MASKSGAIAGSSGRPFCLAATGTNSGGYCSSKEQEGVCPFAPSTPHTASASAVDVVEVVVRRFRRRHVVLCHLQGYQGGRCLLLDHQVARRGVQVARGPLPSVDEHPWAYTVPKVASKCTI